MAEFFKEFQQVLARDNVYPGTPGAYINLRMLHILGLWPDFYKQPVTFTVFCYKFWCISFAIHILTLTVAWSGTLNNIIEFGDAGCVNVGVYQVIWKFMCFRGLTVEFQDLVQSVSTTYKEQNKKCAEITRIQRFYYLQDVLIFVSTSILGVFLAVALCIDPLLSDVKKYPLLAKYPLDYNKPFGFYIGWMFQTTITFLSCQMICNLDNMGGSFVNHICSELEILAIEMKRLGVKYDLDSVYGDAAAFAERQRQAWLELRQIIIKHQKVIGLVDRVNRMFQPMFSAQLLSSMFIICLTAFESTLVMDDKLMFFKFLCYMFCSFVQLFYWTWMGNKVYFSSLAFSDAAFSCDWLLTTQQFKKDLAFVVMRAQKPLELQAHKLCNLSFVTLISVLKNAYSLFTFFRTINED